MTFEQTIIVALITAVLTGLVTWLGQYFVAFLQRRNLKSKYLSEKLLVRYSDFVALASDDLLRARALDALIATTGHEGNQDERIKNEIAKLEERRFDLSRGLHRLAMQISLLETNRLLGDRVDTLANSQPFMRPLPLWPNTGNFNERYDRFKQEIGAFDKLLTELREVAETHSANGKFKRTPINKAAAQPKRKERPSLKELLAGINEDNIHAEIDTGPPVGREVW